jgi:hypothetical protein
MQVAHSYHWFHGLIHTEFCTSCSTPFKCLRVNIHSFSSYVPVTWLAAIIFPCHPRTASFWVRCNVMHLLCLRQVTGPQVALSLKGTCQRIYTSRARKSDDLAHWGSCILVAVMSFLLEQEWETIWARTPLLWPCEIIQTVAVISGDKFLNLTDQNPEVRTKIMYYKWL